MFCRLLLALRQARFDRRSMGRSLLCAFLLLASAISCLAQLADAAWPKFHGDPQNTGQSVYGGAFPAVKWTAAYNDIGITPVTGHDGTVYFAVGKTVYGLDPKTGATTFRVTIQDSVNGTPAIGKNGLIYISGGGATLTALDTQTGAVIWTFQHFNGVYSSNALYAPAIGSDGTVYVGSDDQSLYAVDGDTGAMKWMYITTSYVRNCPAIGPDGTVYAGSSLYAFNPSDGTVKWHLGTVTVTTSPTVGPDGTIYIGCGDSNVYGITPGGTKKWSFATGGIVYGSPVLGANGILYVGSDDGTLYALDSQSGTKIWSLATGEWVRLSPAMGADGTVYLSTSNALCALNGLTGEVLWTFDTQSSAVSPSIGADGSIYLTSGSQVVALQSVYVVSVSVNPNSVYGSQTSTGTVTLSGPAYAGGVGVALSSSSADAVVPTSITIPQGQTTGTFQVTTSPVNSMEQVTITAVHGTVRSTTLTIKPPALVSLSLAPTSVLGGNPSIGTVTLNLPAAPGGSVIALSSANNIVRVPANVTVNAGQTSATFNAATEGVNSQTPVVITATLNGVSFPATLTVSTATLSSLVVNPSSVLGGTSSTGTITLSGPAGTGGTVVNLASGCSSATVPATVTVPAGKTSATFNISTTGVNAQVTGVITATLNGTSQTAQLTITPATIFSLTLNPSSVLGGSPSTGTVTLSGPAAPGGTNVSISSNQAAAIPPSSLTVAAGQTSANFSISTQGVSIQTSAGIKASLGASRQTANLTINPAVLVSVAVAPNTVLGGTSATGTVTLNGPAGSGGTVVSMTSNAIAATVPSSVTVAAGQTTAPFTINSTGVNAQTIATISASLNVVNKTASLTVTPAVLASVSATPSAVVGGNSSIGTVTLNGPAGPSGVLVNLASGIASAIVPVSVTVPAGKLTASFGISTTGVTSEVAATISASLNGTVLNATLTIDPSTLQSLVLNPTTVAGVSPSAGIVTLNGVAGPNGALVSLTSGASVASVPSTVTIPAGQNSATFTVTTTAVTSQTQVPISGTLNGVTRTATLTLLPLGVSSLILSPSAVVGGNPSTGSVTLNGLASKGGVVVRLTSSLAGVTAPASVSISEGQTTATFTVKTAAVSTVKQSNITAAVGTTAASAVLKINPPSLQSMGVSPATVTGGSASSGTVTLSGPAPAGGITVSLLSNTSAATIPASVNVLAGQSTAKFTIKTVAVSSQVVGTISANLSGNSITAAVTVNPPSVTKLSLSPTSVAGGKSATGTITLSGPAPTDGILVSLSSSLAAATVPASLTIVAGKTTGTFTVKTTAVKSKSTAIITATLGASSGTATLTIQ